MQIGGGAAEAARRAAEEAARRAAEAARKAAEAAARKAAEEAAKKAAEAAQAQHAEPTKDASTAAGKSLADAAKGLAEHVTQAAHKNTCAAANKEMQIAEQHPRLHARMAKELEAHGEVEMPNGQKLHLSQKNAEYIDKLEASPEDKASMRIQAAMMDYANPHGEYDMEKDVCHAQDNPFAEKTGLTQEQTTRLDGLDDGATTDTTQEVQGKAVLKDIVGALSILTGGTTDHAENVADTVQQDLKAAESQDMDLTVNVEKGDMLHSMTVVATNDAQNTITLQDTNGTITMTNAQFAQATDSDGQVGEGSAGAAQQAPPMPIFEGSGAAAQATSPTPIRRH